MNDHDLLVRIDERLSNLQKGFSNHIKHHWMMTIPLFAIITGLVITLLIK